MNSDAWRCEHPRVRAIVYQRYGLPDVLELREVEQPTPAADEALVRVHAASVNPVEWHTMTGAPYLVRLGGGLRAPKAERLGADFAGTVEAVGQNVTRFRPGDELFGIKGGALAEYVCVREDGAVAPKPANLSFEEAAAVPIAATTALQGLRDKGRVRSGGRVLINGASGGVGTFAVQLAKWFGADVTGVCSTDKVELARSLGADRVIDYTREDFTRGERRYDLLLDIAGNRSWPDLRRVLEPHATLVFVGGPKTNRLIGPMGHVIGVRLAAVRSGRKVTFFLADVNQAGLTLLSELLENGTVKPVIDRRYELGEAAEALRYLGEGHARGKIVVTV
jgi:NADPH:quinone reductase-like Zn-dependent oxidoreductase